MQLKWGLFGRSRKRLRFHLFHTVDEAECSIQMTKAEQSRYLSLQDIVIHSRHLKWKQR